MTTTEAPATGSRCATDPSASWHLVAHLECFWPSRRVDAFDGLCPAL